VRVLTKYHPRTVATSRHAASPARSEPRNVDKIAQLFTAMAIQHYGYQPGKKSPVPRAIADLAATMGLNVSNDTVLAYLKQGAEFIPPDWKPNKPVR